MKEFLAKTRNEYKTACSVACKVSEDAGEPYKEKYKAKELFEQLLTTTSQFEQFDQFERLSVLTALFHYELGVICLDTEEPAAGEQHLTTALAFLEGYTDAAKYALIPLNIYNQLGILWSARKEHETAMEYLKKAESLYAQVVAGGEFPLTFLRLFSLDDNPDSEGEHELNKAYAHTLYYLAQVYGYLEDAEQAAVYCYKTLKWQIDHKLSFNPMEWSLNSAILSQYFATKDQFSIARHLLACASLNLQESTEKEDSNDDTYQRTKADIQRCWGKYGLSLLTNSKQRLLSSVDSEGDTLPKSPTYEKDRHILLDCDLSHWEDLITDEYILVYGDARGVFLHAQKCFSNAKEYYTMNDYASDYVQIVQNVSELYKVLAFFEPSPERACKMHKRRADMLEETLNALNIKYYQNACRELRFELADIYSEMMDTKRTLKENKIDRKAAEKINSLVEKSIHHFSEFITSVEENKKLPVRFADDLVRPTLLAHFYLARLYSKFIFSEPERQLENLKCSDRYYKFVSDYIEKNPDHKHYINEELEVVTEMLNLLPQRMQMLNFP